MSDQSKAFGKVISQAWSDADFKQRLLANPTEALKEQGITLPAGIELRVVEDTPNRRTLVIPPPPGDLSDEDLDKVAGGGWSVNCGFS